ncbi:hypothetical protein IT157_08470, partial [bacterium]|nr:hypothetical protein [bacterium]
LKLSQDVLWSNDEGWEAGLFVSATEGSDDRSATQASLREIKPRAAYSRFQKGRADVDFAWTHVTSNREFLPFSLSSGANRGENLRWSARVSFAFSQNFSGSLNYTGRQDSGERTFHTGRVEARATF